jgi:type II secretory pathway pseudopilin PulG
MTTENVLRVDRTVKPVRDEAAKIKITQKGNMYMNRKHASKMGFTIVETLITVGIIGLIAAIATPNIVSARESARKGTCINNLRIMDAAMQNFARDNQKLYSQSMQLTDLYPYIRLTSSGTLPGCPSGGTYSVGVISNGPSCSYSGHVLQ